jgi:hypothetical protein
MLRVLRLDTLLMQAKFSMIIVLLQKKLIDVMCLKRLQKWKTKDMKIHRRGKYTVQKRIFGNLDLLKKELNQDDYWDIDWNSFDFSQQKKKQKLFKKRFKVGGMELCSLVILQ